MSTTIKHRVVVATIPRALNSRMCKRERWPGHDIPERVAQFQDQLPAEYRPLLVGPIPHNVNGGETWFFSSAGSKGGDLQDHEVYQWQERFVEIFDRPQCREEDGSHLCTVLVMQWPDSGGEVVATRRV